MFEYAFVPSGQTRRPMLAAVACLGEATLIGTMILAPLLFVQTLPNRALLSALMLAPVPVAPPSPPPPTLVAKKVPQVAPTPRKFNPDALVSPIVVPKVVAMISDAPPVELDTFAGGVIGGIPGPPLTGAGVGLFGNAISAPPPPPPVAVAASAPPPPPVTRQITVGGDVEAALILQQIAPVYPPLARQGHIRGTVILKAIVGTDGKIKNLTAISGHPLLVEAAMSAVRRWIYRPTSLDGAPVEVNTTIEVRFGLTPQG